MYNESTYLYQSLGGKLPGIYGGNGECTGGDESGSCFTSR